MRSLDGRTQHCARCVAIADGASFWPEPHTCGKDSPRPAEPYPLCGPDGKQVTLGGIPVMVDPSMSASESPRFQNAAEPALPGDLETDMSWTLHAVRHSTRPDLLPCAERVRAHLAAQRAEIERLRAQMLNLAYDWQLRGGTAEVCATELRELAKG